VAICLALPSLSVGASPGPEAATVLAGLQAWLEGTRDLEGRFEQSLASGALGAGLAESGRFFLRRPGRMRWDYLEPERKVALIEGDQTRLYLEEEGQLWEGRLEDGALLATLLAGSEPLDEVFQASLLDPPEGGGGGATGCDWCPGARPTPSAGSI